MNCLLILNIFHPDSFNIYTPDQYNIVLQNIINASQDFDFSIMVNDCHHIKDHEFQYLPPHCLVNSYNVLRNTSFEKSLKSPNFLFLTKNTLSAVSSTHNKKLVLDYHFDLINVCGFSGCIDIIPTCLDLIDMDVNVRCSPNLIGDFSKEYQEHAVKTLNLFNLFNICQ